MPGKRSSWPYKTSANYNRYDGDAFFPDPFDGPALAPDDFAEEMAEGYLSAAISGQGQTADAHDVVFEEEQGGPFVITSKRHEFSRDEPGFEDGAPEAFPTSSAQPFMDPPDSDPEPEDYD